MRKRIGTALRLILAAGLAIIAFNGLTFQRKLNPRPLPPQYKKGAFHVHSTFSDGRGGVGEICRDARAQGLDFVVLTDHGRPNRPASAATAWRDGVLLVGASEFSLPAGHLAAAGYRVPGYVFPPEAQEAVDEVERDGGVTFLAHPLDRRIPWSDWSVEGFTGIEILSLYQLAKKNLLYGLTLLPLQYLLSPDYALTALISYPRRELEIWDRLNRRGRHFGIYALDAHAKIPLGREASLHFPSYAATFRILCVYVQVERELDRDPRKAAAAVLAAIRRGRFFSVIESLAAANGFEFYYLEAGGRRVETGGDAVAGGTLVLRLPFAFGTDILVRRDGEPFRVLRDNRRQTLSFPVGGPGVYRCEVSLHSGRFRRLPWILANPVFVDRPAPKREPEPAPEPRALLNPAPGFFHVEKNGRSSGTAIEETGEGGRPRTRFAFALEREPAAVDYWAALANRQDRDLSSYRGFVFMARASRALRFWLQFRTGVAEAETAYRHSFRVDGEWRPVVVPFARFQRLYGPDLPPRLDRVSSLFIAIDNGNALCGAKGELQLGPIGLY